MIQEEIKAIEEQHQKSGAILKALETLLKEQEVNFETHTARISWLQFLLEGVNELKSVKLKQLQAETTKAEEDLGKVDSRPEELDLP